MNIRDHVHFDRTNLKSALLYFFLNNEKRKWYWKKAQTNNKQQFFSDICRVIVKSNLRNETLIGPLHANINKVCNFFKCCNLLVKIDVFTADFLIKFSGSVNIWLAGKWEKPTEGIYKFWNFLKIYRIDRPEQRL